MGTGVTPIVAGIITFLVGLATIVGAWHLVGWLKRRGRRVPKAAEVAWIRVGEAPSWEMSLTRGYEFRVGHPGPIPNWFHRIAWRVAFGVHIRKVER